MPEREDLLTSVAELGADMALVEGYAFRVAKTFENHIDGRTWHQDLIRRMRLEIPGVRPPLQDATTAAHIDALVDELD